MEKQSEPVLRPRCRRRREALTECQDCSTTLNDTNWTPSNQRYRRYICAKCWTARQRGYQEVDPGRKSAKLAKARETRASWSDERKAQEARRKYAGWLRRSYNISIEQYDEMLFEQGGGCAICRATEPGGRGGFHVDHCHDGGFVRALLCSRCNMMIGLAKDSEELLVAAAAYVSEHQNLI